MNEPLSPPLVAFLKRWKQTRGFGRQWRIVDGRYLRTGSAMNTRWLCCPLTAESGHQAGDYLCCVPKDWADEDVDRIIAAADGTRQKSEPEIRRLLLEGVGLA